MFLVGFGLGLPYRDPMHTLAVTRVLIDSLVSIDRLWILYNPSTPSVFTPGLMRYENDPPGVENWLEIGHAVERRTADCKTLTAWDVAALQLQGIAARAAIGWRLVPAPAGHPSVPQGAPMLLIHFFTRLPNGGMRDVSRILGMKVNNEADYRALVRAA